MRPPTRSIRIPITASSITYIHVCVCVCVYINIHVYTCIYDICIYTHTHNAPTDSQHTYPSYCVEHHLHTCVRMFVCIYKYTYVYITYVYIHIHIMRPPTRSICILRRASHTYMCVYVCVYI